MDKQQHRGRQLVQNIASQECVRQPGARPIRAHHRPQFITQQVIFDRPVTPSCQRALKWRVCVETYHGANISDSRGGNEEIRQIPGGDGWVEHRPVEQNGVYLRGVAGVGSTVDELQRPAVLAAHAQHGARQLLQHLRTRTVRNGVVHVVAVHFDDTRHVTLVGRPDLRHLVHRLGHWPADSTCTLQG